MKCVCETCRFFAIAPKREQGWSIHGDCRKNPPVVSRAVMGNFPRVWAGWWCGAYQWKPEVER